MVADWAAAVRDLVVLAWAMVVAVVGERVVVWVEAVTQEECMVVAAMAMVVGMEEGLLGSPQHVPLR